MRVECRALFLVTAVYLALFAAQVPVSGAEQEAPPQVEIELRFLAFDHGDIDEVARQGPIGMAALATFRQKGKSTLVAAPKVRTLSGIEATVKACTECVYPTEFSAIQSEPTGTNAEASIIGVVPDGFETREVGVILSALPEVGPGKDQITVVLSAEIVSPPTWREYSAEYGDLRGKARTVRMEQPFFYSQSLSTTVVLMDRAIAMIGGGMPTEDKKALVYAFLTARIIDVAAEPRQE